VPSQPTNANGTALIQRLLIANRGEIACRIIATARKLNIVSIAVYTEPDAGALHVTEADEAVNLGPIDGPNGNPLLNIDILVQAALDHGADAIHPGYGFLSENAAFSQKVREAKLLFIGPTPRGMEVLGDKRQAKSYLLEHAPGIPVVPGYNGSEQDFSHLTEEAERIGFPILIKASAGGGGKGMRIVHDRDDFENELKRAMSEAKRSFGSSDCILEKYVQRSKHIEIQIFGDSYGHIISLLERECSIQRRHQKVIEESPSPWLLPEMRQQMSQIAIAIGKLIGYEGAGTVEFIVDVDTKRFYFLEVNTRIQVEHPITEETTSIDIVALQFYVAAGGRLTDLEYLNQVTQTGHSIEARLCAEDPLQDFMPDLGRILRWTPSSATQSKAKMSDVRFETGITTGSEVSIHFDSMIAKIIVWAPTRPLAIAKMLSVLAETVCIGVRTNQLFLQACLCFSKFRNPEYSTSFIPENKDLLLWNPYTKTPLEIQRMLAFIPSMLFRHKLFQSSGPARRGPFQSLPQSFHNQRADKANVQADIVRISNQLHGTFLVVWPLERNLSADSFSVTIIPLPPQSNDSSLQNLEHLEVKPSVQIAQYYNEVSKVIRNSQSHLGSMLKVTIRKASASRFHASRSEQWLQFDCSLEVNARKWSISAVTGPEFENSDAGSYRRVFCHIPTLGSSTEYHRFLPLAYGESLRSHMVSSEASSNRSLKAPMPCKILMVAKKHGEMVRVGDAVMVIESMKTEIKMSASVEGKFTSKVAEGDAVDEGTLLFTIDE
jgi:acetyl/propionyl-CoA carboxylase alpha subunit